MEQGSFSRGDDKGTVSAEAGIVFNGNIDGDSINCSNFAPFRRSARYRA